jgi:hypothetical protein
MVDAGKLIKRIQEMRDEGYLSDAILRESVKQLKAGDVDYNFVGVYLLNPDEQVLWLHNYMGDSDRARAHRRRPGRLRHGRRREEEPERRRRLPGRELPRLQPQDEGGARRADPRR